MKKVMISSLILLPLVILLILSLSTAIVSATSYVYVESVEFVGEEETVVLYKTAENPSPSVTMKVNVFPLMATNKEVEFFSDNEDVVKIDAQGVVTGVNFGETYIHVKSKENNIKTATKKVVVTDDKVHSVNIVNPPQSLTVGEEYQLEWTVSPDGAQNRSVTWSSSSPEVAQVSFGGKITALSAGTADITVTSDDDPSVSDTITVKVNVYLEDVVLEGNQSPVSMGQSEAKFPEITFYPEGAQAEISYQSSDPTIATVDEDGVISFLRSGTVTVRATIEGSDEVFEKQYTYTAGYVESVLFTGDSEVNYEDYALQGKPLNITFEQRPVDSDKKNVRIEISDENVITRKDDGMFYVTGGGVAVITAIFKTSENTEEKSTFTVKVNRKTQDISILDETGEQSGYIYTFSNVYSINARVIPSDATYAIKYSTDAEGVRISGNKVIFSDSDYYKKARIRAVSEDGKEKEFTLVYINDDKVNVFEITQDTGPLTVYMPDAIVSDQTARVAFVVRQSGLNDVTASCGEYAEFTSTGTNEVEVVVNGESFATFTLTVVRRVEEITITGLTQYFLDGSVYENGKIEDGKLCIAANRLAIGYSIYPANADTKEAVLQVFGDSARIENNEIVFTKEGTVQVRLSADEQVYEFSLTSTYGYPDDTSVFKETIQMSVGESMATDNIIEQLRPFGADKKYVLFAFEGDCITVENGVITATKSGFSKITVNVQTCEGLFTAYCNVIVYELSDDLRLTAQSSINLGEFLDSDIKAQPSYVEGGNNNISYALAAGQENAQLSGEQLTFSTAGEVLVRVDVNGSFFDVRIESTMGKVKVAKWNEQETSYYYSDGQADINASEYTLLPADADASTYEIFVADDDVAVCREGKLYFAKGGETVLALKYTSTDGNTYIQEKRIVVHNPAQSINIVYDGRTVKNIITEEISCQLKYELDTDMSMISPYSVYYSVSDENTAYVSAQGRVTFRERDKAVDVTVRVVNSDGSEISTVVTMMSSSARVIRIDENTTDLQFDFDAGSQYVFYVIPPQQDAEVRYEIVVGEDVVTVDKDGKITAVRGGRAQIKISAVKDSVLFEKTVEINVYRKTTDISFDEQFSDNVYSSKTQFDLNAKVMPEDSAWGKQIVYGVDDESVATVTDGKVTFVRAGEVTVAVKVIFNGVTEAEKSVVIKSSFGKIDDFAFTDGTAYNNFVFEDDGLCKTFSISNVSPSDFQGQAQVTTNIPETLDIKRNDDRSFSITSSGRGTGTVSVTFGGLTKTFDVTAKIRVNSIQVSFGNYVFEDKVAYTMQDNLRLSVNVSPLNANDRTLIWNVDNGGYYDEQTGVLHMPTYGVYNVTVRSADGGAQKSFKVERTTAAGPFMLVYEGKEYSSDTTSEAVIELGYNESSVVVSVKIPQTDFIGEVNFDAICDQGVTFSQSGDEILLKIPAYTEESPTFRAGARIVFGSAEMKVTINRDGIKVIEFTDHDNINDDKYGLQQIRVFGKSSYYDGAKRNYYRLPVKVSPSNAAKNLVWTASSPEVKIAYSGGDYAQIDFSAFNGNSETDVRNDVFDKTVTVTATDASGMIKDSYTFHIVNDGVNVFDQAGYLANSAVVLHTSLSSNESDRFMGKLSPYTHAADTWKALIYGNGFTVNYDAWNDVYNKSTHGNNVNTSIGRSYNATFKGADYDASKSSYHNCFIGSYVYYCKIQQSYKGIYATDGTTIRNCSFRYLKDMSVQISDSDKVVYIENIISIDGGNAALECQCKSFYFKGFIDVYNFKSKDDLAALAGTSVIADWVLSDLKKKGNFVANVNGKDYFNVVLYSGKSGGSDRPMYFWNGSEYVAAGEGTAQSASGLKKLTSGVLLAGTVAAWSYELDVIDYYDQFNADGSENNENLAKQEAKLLRTNNTN